MRRAPYALVRARRNHRVPTYIPTGEGWLYLAAILDMHTRKIVGWSMRETLHTEIALDALSMAPGLIHHSDRGIQYAAEAYRSALAHAGITPSMSRKGGGKDDLQRCTARFAVSESYAKSAHKRTSRDSLVGGGDLTWAMLIAGERLRAV